METTHTFRSAVRLAAIGLTCLFGIFSSASAQMPVVTARFTNPTYDCANNQYCVDVEFLSDSVGLEIFGVNIRFFYPDTLLELVGFSDYQGGYGPVAPDPPTVSNSVVAGPTLFDFDGSSDFVNGAIQLLNPDTTALLLDSIVWTKLFQVCFTVEPAADIDTFCPSLVWDLEQDPANGGFLIGDDGLVITMVDPDPMIESAPVIENVIQFNWEYTGDGTTTPYGTPVETECISLDCAPMIICAADVTIECHDSTDPDSTGFPVITDICDGDPVVMFTDSIAGGSCPDSFTIFRTWIATNDCMLSDTCIQLISVIDTTGPALLCPADTLIDCTSAIDTATLGVATAIDACDTLVTITFADVTVAGTCPQEFVLTRTWTATDDCGNSTTCAQVITVQDTLAPVIACPADTLIDCTSAIDTATLGVATAIDACDTLVAITFADVTVAGMCPQEYVLTRTWTATDDCGNSTTCAQVITVQDTLAPVIICPSDTLIDCTSAIDTATLGVATAIDACDTLVTIAFADVTVAGTCAQEYVLTRTWTATDDCGNSTTCAQVITVQDTLAPVIICPADTLIDCTSAIDTATLGVATAIDACDTLVAITFADVTVAGTCAQEYVLTRTWTAVDDCGNSTTCAQVITVQDTLAPVITCPSDTLIDCTSAIDTATLGVAIASDACDTLVAITFADVTVAGTCAQEYVLTRTWTATDDCGNSSTCDQVITVQDTLAPMIICPADTLIDCTSAIDTATLGVATAIDACDTLVAITFADVTVAGTCAQEYVLTRTWTATDDCGNSSTCDQVITVQDTLAPTIICPADTLIDCTSAIDTATLGVATAIDACDTLVAITFADVTIAGMCAQEYVLTRTWTATDDCGNSTTCAQVITVQDTLAPVIMCPADTLIDCTSAIDTTTLGVATAIDACDTLVAITFADVTVAGMCVQEYVLTRTWTAVDDCGNSTTCAQVITVQDTLAPVIICPADTLIDCISAIDTATLGVATAIDACDTLVTITFADVTVAGTCPQEFVLTRTWTATDDCGNSTTCAQVITVQDTLAPVIACPADTLIDCTSAIDTATLGVATAIDACDTLVAITFADVTVAGMCAQEYVLTRTWTATDDCGNSTTCAQVITVQDTLAPVITCPADTLIDCTSAIDTATLGVATAIDACDTLVAITFADVTVAGMCAQEYVLTRTWTATDDCGNSTTCAQVITVQDTLAPVITCPSDTLTDCTSAIDTATLGVATAIDACDTVVAITFADVTVAGMCAQEYVLTRTWTATDDCGNSTTCAQVITVQDTLAPVITCPSDTLIDCTSAIDTATLGVATAIDACDTLVTITFADVTVAGMCAQEYVLTRTWTAVDDCGNSTTCAQVITVQDTLAPVIICPADTLIDCTSAIDTATLGVATAIDACDTLVAITFADVTVAGMCAQEYVLTRTWTAVDDCGNSTTCAQVITVQDTLAPVIICPADTLIDCTSAIDTTTLGVATAIDACDTLVAITFADVTVAGMCVQEYVLTRTWTATDDCGNSTTCAQVITVQDTLAPVIICPADTLIDCTSAIDTATLGVATAIDACDTLVAITFADVTVAGTCAQEYVLTRTWTAVDDCGNSTTCAQVITVQDTLEPVIICPADTLIDCTSAIDTATLGVATAIDACDTLVAITFADVTIAGMCAQEYVLARTWTATDDCGNSTTCAQVITVQDTLAPVIICPADTLIDCTSAIDTATLGVATAIDACDTLVTITFADVTVAGMCAQEYVLTRTWTAVDDCGNSTTCAQVITVQDTLAPVIICPADTLIDCTSAIDTATLGVATAIDACDTLVAITFADVTVAGMCAQEYVLTRTWTAVDDCGNSTTCAQVITVQDTLAPVIICPADTLIDCTSAIDTATLGVATAIDACDTLVAITFADVTVAGMCAQEYVLTRTWTATDDCGNSTTCAQVITVQDTLPPVITCPADTLIDCTSAIDTATLGVATAIDACDTLVTITFADVTVAGMCAQEYVLTRTWTAVDDCGNSTTCAQVITVQDTLAPVIICPSDTLIDCTSAIDTATLGVATAIDACDTLVAITFADVTVAGICPQEYVLTRTWTAVDDCGNSSTCDQVITVQDTLAPVIICPADTLIDCTSAIDTATLGAATAIDACDTLVAITFADVTIAGMCPQEYVLTRTWTAVDDCGNSATCAQVITVQDTLAPLLVCPPDTILDSESSTDPSETGIASASDNCSSEPTIDFSDVTMEGNCENDYTITRTWTAIDECGNSSTCNQIIEVVDCVVDLALIKELDAGQNPVAGGDDITFTITVTNEGEEAISSVTITDYIPLGFVLNDPDWTAGMEGSTGQSASITLSIMNGNLGISGLLPGESISVQITLMANPDIMSGIYENIAEISVIIDSNGTDVSDADTDSDADEDDTNDPPTEDDHDPAFICVLDPVIIGPDLVCAGDTVVYEIDQFNPANTYSWVLENGGGIILESTDSTLTIVWGNVPGGPFLVIVTESVDTSCVASDTVEVMLQGFEPLACIDHINLSIDNECGTVVLSGLILTGDQSDDNSYTVIIKDQFGNIIPDATFTYQHVGQTFTVMVLSECSGQSCWGTVTVEDKLPPEILCVCPEGSEQEPCTITCFDIDAMLNGQIPEEFRPTVADNCGGTTLEITDIELSFESCANGFVAVTWQATDAGNNTSTCIQQIDIVPLTLEGLDFPDDYFGACDDNPHPDFTGWPQVDGLDLTNVPGHCNILATYTDNILPLCGGGTKIFRTWSVFDWCVPETREFVQFIILGDSEGPVLTCPADITVGTDVWFCYANVTVPRPLAVDACSELGNFQLFSPGGTVIHNGNTARIEGLGIGTHTVTWTVYDECFNSSVCSFSITVVDNVPPVPSCQQHLVVSLTNDRPNGITLVPASAFDDNSHDNCSDVTIRARRMDSCIDLDWTTGGACIDDIPDGSISEQDYGVTHGICVPFSCCDVGSGPIMVEIEMTDEAGNINYCMVEVEVQDKLAPAVVCPPDITISCDFAINFTAGVFADINGNNDGSLDEDPLSAVFGNVYDAFRHSPSVRQPIIILDPSNDEVSQPHAWGIDGWATDNCEIELHVVVNVIEDCSGAGLPGIPPPGAVKLITRRFMATDAGNNDGGNCVQRIWVVDFEPFFITDTTCANVNVNDGVIWPCDVTLTECPDELSGTGEPVIFEDGCSLIGVSFQDTRFDFADGACYKILREWTVLDWCQFDAETGAGLWSYTQTIKVADATGPAFLNCPAAPVTLCLGDPGISLPDNNQIYLGEGNQNAGSCSVHVALSQTVQDMCSESVTYEVRVYPFNGNEFIVLTSPTVIQLDDHHQGVMSFNTQTSSIPSISEDGLPYNTPECGDYHRVVWIVEDGCGNLSECDYLFRLEDCKAPTPVCLNGISAMVMGDNGEVTIWASDFDASSVDDCTPSEQLLFSFSESVYEPSFTYNCDNVETFGEEIPVEIWVADAGSDDNCNGQIEWGERNRDVCITYIIITDELNICEENGFVLNGEVKTEYTEPVGNVHVRLFDEGDIEQFQFTTQSNGLYEFDNLSTLEYRVVPERNDDHDNGVSTLDLVRIQKHLLGKEPFTSPYQYIAADANNSQSISAIDLLDIRKLILGIYEEFPSNKSWRFTRKDQAMSPGHPWPLDEEIHFNPASPPATLDFTGIKIGDVNNTVKANATQIVSRSAPDILPVSCVVNGEIMGDKLIEVKLIMPRVEGFQWTIETSGLEYVSCKSKDILMDESNIAVHDKELLTMSWNSELIHEDGEEISMVFEFIVTDAGSIEHMIKLSSQITKAEAYSKSYELFEPRLNFDAGRTFTDFALYQNKPNPWEGHTLIGFDLPQDAVASLIVYDVAGKVLKEISGEYKAGFNTIMLSSRDIPAPGIIYYRLESGEYSATKKMVMLR